MDTFLLTTKLCIPPLRPNLVPRPQLIERLDAGLRAACKLVLISAPAGFGKTTLLSEWFSDSEKTDDGQPRNLKSEILAPALRSGPYGSADVRNRVAWLSLDQGDNDPTRFWAYLVAALQTIRPGLGQDALTALQSPQPPPAEALLTGLINEIAGLAEPCILVLDDYHVISAVDVNDAMTFLLDHLPPQMCLVVASRADPPWPLARLRARCQIVELRVNDLRFTPDEVAAFLNQAMRLALSAENVAALDARTEGWIAGLQMAALSMQGRKDTAAFIEAFSGSHHFILDYLVEEVLDRQSGEIQDFLLETCILNQMTASLCDAVTGRNDSQALLSQLGQANLFVMPLDDERRWYRYHRLFADLLRSRLEQTRPGRSLVLHRRASEWYEGAALVEEAVTHAFAGKDWERAADLIEQNAEPLTIYGKQATLSHWIRMLPDELLRTRPKLCVYHAGALHWIGRRESVEEYLRAAEQSLESVSSPAERRQLAGQIAAIRAHAALTDQEIPLVLEMGQKALELLPEEDCMCTYASVALGGAHWGQGDVRAAQKAFDMARIAALRNGYRLLAVSPACYVGMQQTKQGQLDQAIETFRAALELATGPSGRQLPVAGFPNVKLGDLLREKNDLEAARHYVRQGVEQCLQLSQADVLADSHVALAHLQMAEGNRPGALDALQKAEQLARQTKIDPFVLCWLDDCRVRLWLLEGNLEAAVRWAETSGLTVNGKLSYHYDLHHINLARVLVAQGAREPSGPCLSQSLALLDRLLAAAEKAGWIHEQIKVLILQALALETRNDKGALDALTRALALAEPGGYVRAFVDEGAPMTRLLRQAIARGVAADYAARLLAALEKEMRDAGPGTDQVSWSPAFMAQRELVEPLSEREIKVLRLLNTSLSTPDIAQELVVSTNTVRSHVKSIYGKLSVHGRREAIQRAQELGLL